MNNTSIYENRTVERIEWIDFAKGIGIILVVFGHSGIDKYVPFLHTWIYSFHMPLFFIISGMIFNCSKYTNAYQLFTSLCKQLLKPYLYFTLINLILMFVVLRENDINFYKHVIFFGWGGRALWFIPVLFVTKIFYYQLTKVSSQKSAGICSRDFQISLTRGIETPATKPLTQNIEKVLTKITKPFYMFFIVNLLYFFGYFLYKNNVHLPYKIEVVFTSLLYLYIGKNILSFDKKTNILKIKIISFRFLLILAASLIFTVINVPRLDMASNTIGILIPSFLASLSGSFLVLKASHFICDIEASYLLFLKKIVVFLGKNTFILLAFHQIVLEILISIFQSLSIPPLYSSVLRHILMWLSLVGIILTINKIKVTV